MVALTALLAFEASRDEEDVVAEVSIRCVGAPAFGAFAKIRLHATLTL